MQIPIISGVFTDGRANFRASYPLNLTPVVQPQGITAGYLRPAEGIVQNGTGPVLDETGQQLVRYGVRMDQLLAFKLAAL